jgi:hypothetical protein
MVPLHYKIKRETMKGGTFGKNENGRWESLLRNEKLLQSMPPSTVVNYVTNVGSNIRKCTPPYDKNITSTYCK